MLRPRYLLEDFSIDFVTAIVGENRRNVKVTGNIKKPLPDAPSLQATTLIFSNITDDSFEVSWTRGNGEGVLLVAHVGAEVDSSPTIGINYTASDTFGNGDEIGTGNFVIYRGTGTSVVVNHNGLRGRYDFKAFEFNETVYNTEDSSGNPASLVNPKLITGLAGWIDASQIVGLADGQEIVSLTEFSGLGKVLTPTAASRRPTYETNEINGFPVIRIGASSDNFQGLKADWDFMHQGDTTHIQLFKRSSPAFGFIFDSNSGSSATVGRAVLANANNSISDSQYAATSGQNVFSSTSGADTYPLNQWNIIVSRYEAGKTGNDHILDINNVEVVNSQGILSVSALTSNNLPTFFNRNDATTPVNGDLAQWLFFSVALSENAISDLVGGLENNYGL